MSVLKFIVKFMWELPSNIVALLLLFFLGVDELHWDKKGLVIADMSFRGAMTLGCYIFCNAKDRDLLEHEYGHVRQGWVLGPLYLLVIGIPSLIWCTVYKSTLKPYDWFYTERWMMKIR